jgi:hypothetical protein
MTTKTTVKFESGATRRLDPDLAKKVVGLTAEGRVVVKDDFADYLFGLTLCCNAYDKGYEDGIYCRKCAGEDAGEYDAVVSDPIKGGAVVTVLRPERNRPTGYVVNLSTMTMKEI